MDMRRGVYQARQPGMIIMVARARPWLRCMIGVVKDAVFATTSEYGSYTIRNLEPGDYRISAWHPLMFERPSALVQITATKPDVNHDIFYSIDWHAGGRR